ncbi:MAG: phosphate acyltransferase PlsX [Epulopiscium sp.]|nr:phosphate acyltransferase PlsX [Candidatus Epulonipiscium sp.]
MIIAVDGMGGDNAPVEIVRGCVQAVKDFPIQVLLVGEPTVLEKELANYEFDKNRLLVTPAMEVITNDDPPVVAIRTKKDSSMVVGLKLVKEKKASAFISAGNSGALLTGGTVLVGRIPKVERPALAPLIPHKKGFSLLLDCGANVDAKPSYLAQFAHMGSLYMEQVLNIAQPKVGLINIGTEKEKGNDLTKAAYELLEGAPIHFIGNVEARDIPSGVADVLVCDAFVGNILLKYTEGFGLSLFDIIKEELTKNFISKIAALFLKPSFKRVKDRFDYTEYGGAPLLGLQGLVVKAHGSSNSKAIYSAIKQSLHFIDQEVVEKTQNIFGE